MKKIEVNVGPASVIDEFLTEVAAAPSQVRELVLISPFVQLSSKASKSGSRLCNLIRSVNSHGGTAVLVSDDTPSRRKDFRRAIQKDHDLLGTLFLCKGLHAKCGLATNSVGHQVAFLGSANLTDSGLKKNAEVVLGFKGTAYEGPLWALLGQLRTLIERIRSNSFQLNNN